MSLLRINRNQKDHKFENFHFRTKRPPAFEGFYFKGYQKDGILLVIICGYSKSRSGSHAFLQVSTPENGTQYFEYELSSINRQEGTFNFDIGPHSFSNKGISINEEDCKIAIEFTQFFKWPRSILNPSIMGLLGHVPRVECKHDIVSPGIVLKGSARINGSTYKFTNASGYIDKNWGESFPKSYYWGHITGFTDPSISIQFTKGYPLWGRWRVPVYVGFLKIGENIHTFHSWKIDKMTLINVGHHEIYLENRKWKVTVKLNPGIPLNLRAPSKGSLNDKIVEHAGGNAIVRITRRELNKTEKVFLEEEVNGTTFESR